MGSYAVAPRCRSNLTPETVRIKTIHKSKRKAERRRAEEEMKNDRPTFLGQPLQAPSRVS